MAWKIDGGFGTCGKMKFHGAKLVSIIYSPKINGIRFLVEEQLLWDNTPPRDVSFNKT